ncbi:MAG: flagellar hook-basal body complex protein FliE [Pseudomonadales bacterium]
MNTTRVEIDSVLAQMRVMRSQAQGINPAAGGDVAVGNAVDVRAPGEASFKTALTSAIDSVNATQKQSGALAKAYELGDPKVSLSDVMVASQKSAVSFQAMTQVRNKLVEAYQEVMNMPV